MSTGWTGAQTEYGDKKPTENTVSASVNRSVNETLLIEEFADKYVIHIFDMNDLGEFIYEIRRGVPTHGVAKRIAERWMGEHPNGTADL